MGESGGTGVGSELTRPLSQICQLGNFSIHMALRDLRPAGEWPVQAGVAAGAGWPGVLTAPASSSQALRPGRSRTPPRTPSPGSSCWCPAPTIPMR